ncbi:hypothetical protein [Bacillus cereus]|uniref:hypothetical protein n=1 Tax=Bacillus cereus TaxID=1396 RepID=UPI00217E9815|nr:hypothetical protein [Bacillus cereus]MCS6595300.1 hypothetical protein [Bacillus cereus]
MGNIPFKADPDTYRQQAREEIFSIRSNSTLGFRDYAGYIVDYINGLPTTRGEATLHTSIAAIAISSGNFTNQDEWEINNVNRLLKELLTTLLYRSWGNKDSSGVEHPIRHPDVIEYDANGKKIRCSPLTKDSFGAIITAGCLSYICPNSNNEVKTLANDLIVKWSDYLTQFHWCLHSNYIPNEFESEKINGKLYYKNIFSENGGRVMYKGPESYTLMPHEIFALKNVATLLGISTNHWCIWMKTLPFALKKVIIDDVSPFLTDIFGDALSSALDKIFMDMDMDMDMDIAYELKGSTANSLHTVILDLMCQSINSDMYINSQALEIPRAAFDNILPLTDSHYELITKTLQEKLFLDEQWLEIVVFLGTQQLLKLMDPDVVSYTLWSFISEYISQPKIHSVLKWSSNDFFSYLQENHNTNGLWAWFAGREDIVKDQLELFESRPQRYWWKFAYGSKKFEDWIIEPIQQDANGRESPRLDYLVLNGLNNMKSVLLENIIGHLN